MRQPTYCTQNGGDCLTCALVNYGRDCENNPVGATSKPWGDVYGPHVTAAQIIATAGAELVPLACWLGDQYAAMYPHDPAPWGALLSWANQIIQEAA